MNKSTLWTFRWYMYEQFLPQNLSWWKKAAPPLSGSPFRRFWLVHQPSFTRLPEIFGSYDTSNIFHTEYEAGIFNLKLETMVVWLYHAHYIWFRKVHHKRKSAPSANVDLRESTHQCSVGERRGEQRRACCLAWEAYHRTQQINKTLHVVFSCPEQLNRWPCHSLTGVTSRRYYCI